MGVFGFQLAKTKSSYIYKTERVMNEVSDFLYFPSLSSTSRQHTGARHRSREADLMPCVKVKEQKKPQPNNVGIPVPIYTRRTPTFRGLTMGLAEACCRETARHIGLWPFGPVSSLQTPSSNECLLILLPLSPRGRQPFASARVD